MILLLLKLLVIILNLLGGNASLGSRVPCKITTDQLRGILLIVFTVCISTTWHASTSPTKCHQHPFFLEHGFHSLPQQLFPSSCWLNLQHWKSLLTIPAPTGLLTIPAQSWIGAVCEQSQEVSLRHRFMHHWSEQSSTTRISRELALLWRHVLNINYCHFIRKTFQQYKEKLNFCWMLLGWGQRHFWKN